MVKLYETNKKLNDALLVISTYQENIILQERKFIPSTEKLDTIVINEVEETIKNQKKNKKTNTNL